MNTPLTHELECPPVGYDDINITSKAGSGGMLTISATLAFCAKVDIPAWSRQSDEIKDAERDNLRQVVRDRFYGDMRRAAVKAVAAVEKLCRMAQVEDGCEAQFDTQFEAVQAAFMPLLNAGDALVIPPAQPEGGS